MSFDPMSAAPAGTLPDQTTPRLAARALRVRYGETTALDRVDLAVADGEAVAIMGPSGSGKSTLLHAMAGIIGPDEGSVHLRTGTEGTEVVELVEMSDRERSDLRLHEFGFVFQQGMLIPELTAVENVMMPLLLTDVAKDEAVRRASALLEELGLAGLGDRRMGQLSGGQAQRVAIARARATDARVVFADEPTGALDSRTASEVLEVLLSETSARGRALVMVTHDEEVAGACSRIVRLRDGRIMPVGVEDTAR